MTDIFEIFSHVTVGWILPILFMFTVIVFVHEMGHFLVARWCGVRVETFSIGFGPELIGRTDRRGTRWRISALPLGGYVKFVGDMNAASAGPSAEALKALPAADRKGLFATASLPRRAAIVAAGPIANFLFAILVFGLLLNLAGERIVPPRVDEVVVGSAAEAAGLAAGDLVVAIDGDPIESVSELQRITATSVGRELQLTVDRGGELVTIAVTPRSEPTEDRFGNTSHRGQIGMQTAGSAENSRIQTYPLPEAMWRGTVWAWDAISSTARFLGRVIVGAEPADQIGGPVSVARAASEAASIGFLTLISMAAAMSLSIGFTNLLPIPLLDGGHLMFYAYEAVRGRPPSPAAQEIGLRIGLVLLLALMTFATINDFI